MFLVSRLGATPQQAPPTVHPSPTSTTPAPSVTTTPSVSPRPTAPAVVSVKASLPVLLEVPKLQFRYKVKSEPMGSPINPPVDPNAVFFDTSRGTSPGSSTTNTSYIFGHTCRSCVLPFNVLDRQLQPEDDLYVTTVQSKRHHVRLHYRVIEEESIPQELVPSAASVWAPTPNTLILMTCHLRSDGEHQTDNRVFYAQYIGTV